MSDKEWIEFMKGAACGGVLALLVIAVIVVAS